MIMFLRNSKAGKPNQWWKEISLSAVLEDQAWLPGRPSSPCPSHSSLQAQTRPSLDE